MLRIFKKERLRWFGEDKREDADWFKQCDMFDNVGRNYVVLMSEEGCGMVSMRI